MAGSRRGRARAAVLVRHHFLVVAIAARSEDDRLEGVLPHRRVRIGDLQAGHRTRLVFQDARRPRLEDDRGVPVSYPVLDKLNQSHIERPAAVVHAVDSRLIRRRVQSVAASSVAEVDVRVRVEPIEHGASHFGVLARVLGIGHDRGIIASLGQKRVELLRRVLDTLGPLHDGVGSRYPTV